jgi:hypothetical protein
MQTTRRGFLSTLGILAVGVALPPPLMARHLNLPQLDELHHHAQSLAQQVHGTPPIVILQSARAHLVDVEALLAAAIGRHRLSLHRTAGLTALVAAHASRWAARPRTATLLEQADQHAHSAGDGVLRAQVLVLRAKTAGEEAYAIDAGYTPAQRHLAAALAVAGPTPLLRAQIRYELAWDLAAAGDRHGALLELDAAEVDHDCATPAADVVEVADGTWRVRRWSSGYRGAVLRRLGLHGDAIAACSEVLQGPPQWQTSAMVDMARSHAALGDVDAAAASLEDAYLLNARAGLAQRQGRVRAARALLPDGPAVRQLDAVLRG